MMYDELVRRLRELASIPEHCEAVEYCDQCPKENICLSFTNKQIIEVVTQAADTIEELRKAVLRLEDESGLYDELPTFYIYPTKEET